MIEISPSEGSVAVVIGDLGFLVIGIVLWVFCKFVGVCDGAREISELDLFD